VAPADHTQRAWIYTRMQALCRDLGTMARMEDDVLVIERDAATLHE
jgi:poly-gamma-glutamate synthesis protein (capsule biosynthesis protein)